MSTTARIPGVTGVILAGGHSTRMGSNKALLPYKGGRFIEAIHRQLGELFDELLLVTNTSEQYRFLPCRMVADVYQEAGALAGLHAGLLYSRTPYIFAVACDMPYLNPDLIRKIVSLREDADVVLPSGDKGNEPLHALYGKRCLQPMEEALSSGRRRIVSFFDAVRVQHLSQEEVAKYDPVFDSFKNINTPQDYYLLREHERSETIPSVTRTGVGGYRS